MYRNAIQVGATFTSETYIKDESFTASQLIGAATDLTDFYFGFIWKVVLCNYISPIVNTDFAGSSQPSGLPFQLSPCPFLQTINCVGCGSGCSNGCVRTTDCSLCADPLCSLCHDFLGCSQCVVNASGLPTCMCNSGFVFTAGSSYCSLCSVECRTCNGVTASNCLSCLSNAQLVVSTCTCLSGYFPDPHPGHCSPCLLSCMACANQNSCLSCFPDSHSHLAGGACLCDTRYEGTPPSCVPCPEGCVICQSFCIQCLTGYFNLGGVCILHCPTGYIESNELCLPEPRAYLPFTANLTLLQNQTLELNFSSPLSRELQESDFVLNISISNSTKLPFNLSFLVWVTGLSYHLNLNISGDCFDATLNLTFLNPFSLTDINFNSLQTSNLYSTLTLPCVYIPPPSLVPATNSAAATVTKGSVTMSAVGSISSGSASGLFTLINNLQLLAYLPLSTIPFPQGLRDLLSSLNMQSFIPNPFLHWLKADEGEKVPDFASSYGYESCLFLANCGVMVAVGVLVLTYWGVVRILMSLPLGLVSFYLREQMKGILAASVFGPVSLYLAAGRLGLFQFLYHKL